MNQYVTGAIIKKLREKKEMTQQELAEKLAVSDKAVSKWETAKGYPDITLLEPLAAALGVSAAEILTGNDVTNTNRAANMLRTKFYVCPVCGNIITASGEAVISCHGITLPALEAEEPDENHTPVISCVEDEYFAELPHDMTKEHYISFFAGLADDKIQLVKLYPEGNAEARFKISRTKYLYYYCNRHGLFCVNIRKAMKKQ